MGLLASKLQKKNISENEILNISKEIARRILTVSNPLAIYLFGSAAECEMYESSDYDFMVLFNDSNHLIKDKKEILNSKLFTDLSIDILFFSLQDFNRKSQIGGVAWEIKNKGILIYDQRSKI